MLKKLYDVTVHLYAATSYLQQLGNPSSISELSNANFIDVEKSGLLLSLLNAQGFNLSPDNFPVVTKNHIVQWELVKQGIGICGTLEEIGDSEPLVERVVVPGLDPISVELWLAVHKELRTNRRVRRVFDFLVSEFANYQHK